VRRNFTPSPSRSRCRPQINRSFLSCFLRLRRLQTGPACTPVESSGAPPLRSPQKRSRVIPNGLPRFFFPAAVRRARDVARDLLFAEQPGVLGDRSFGLDLKTRESLAAAPTRRSSERKPRLQINLPIRRARGKWSAGQLVGNSEKRCVERRATARNRRRIQNRARIQQIHVVE